MNPFHVIAAKTSIISLMEWLCPCIVQMKWYNSSNSQRREKEWGEIYMYRFFKHGTDLLSANFLLLFSIAFHFDLSAFCSCLYKWKRLTEFRMSIDRHRRIHTYTVVCRQCVSQRIQTLCIKYNQKLGKMCIYTLSSLQYDSCIAAAAAHKRNDQMTYKEQRNFFANE